MIFGSGTRLNVEPIEEYDPSYYKLSDGHTSVCLATGFSRAKAAYHQHQDVFKNQTEAVRITDELLYNQVTVLSTAEEIETCVDAEEQASASCEDSLEPDAKMNLLSLTILGLRLLFIKTIVFNVLMTLQLWISR